MGDDNIITVSFNVSSASTDPKRFRQFIDSLRRMLRVEDRPYVMQDAMRLPPQQDAPDRWLDIRLSSPVHTITMRLRADNLYVVGFRNGEGRWFELGHNDGHGSMIQGSTILRVRESYTGSNSLHLNENVQIGRHAIEEAVNGLAVYNDETAADDADLRRWLLRLIVRFAESIRLNAVADLPMDDSGSGLTVQLVDLIKSWQKLCLLLLAAANDVVQDPEVLRRRFESYTGLGIHNAFGAAAALGMVLISNSHRRSRRQKRAPALSDNDNDDGAVAGLTLVEVIDVIIRDIDGEDPGDLYGVITITDGFGLEHVFHRGRSDTQSVSPGQQARLTGPGRAMSGADGFAINFNLLDRDTDPSPDDEVSKGELVWDPLDATSDEYDRVHSKIMAGEHGSVELHYAVITDAAVATVEVLVVDSSESAPNVYGFVTTATTLDDGAPVRIDLLATGDTESTEVEKGSAVPLLRKVVAVPLSSELQVNVILKDRNRVFADDQIADGYVNFQPRLAGEEEKEVTGGKGRVAVRVAWKTWFN